MIKYLFYFLWDAFASLIISLCAFAFLVITFRSTKIGNFELVNFSIDGTLITVHTKYKEKDNLPIKIDLKTKKISNDYFESSIDYANLPSLLRLQNVTIDYVSDDLTIEAKTKSIGNGIVSIQYRHIPKLDFKYSIINRKKIILESINSLSFSPLGIAISRKNKLKITIDLSSMKIEGKSLDLNIVADLNKRQGELFINTKVCYAKINGYMEKDNNKKDILYLNMNSEFIDIFRISCLIGDTLKGGYGHQGQHGLRYNFPFPIMLSAKGKHLAFENNSLYYATIGCFVDYNKIKFLNGTAYTKNDHEVLLNSDNYSSIFGKSNAFDDICDLFVKDGIASGGQVDAEIDLNDPELPWKCNVHNTKLTKIYESIVLKQLPISPISIIRRMLSEPDFIEKVEAHGTIMGSQIKLKDCIAENHYYKIFASGIIDPAKNNLSLKAGIMNYNILHYLLTKNVHIEPLKDVTKVNITGHINAPSIKIAHISVGSLINIMGLPQLIGL